MKQPSRVGEEPLDNSAFARGVRKCERDLRRGAPTDELGAALSFVTAEFARAEEKCRAQNAEADTLPGLDPKRTTISKCAGRVFVKYLASDGLYISESAYINSSYPLDIRGLIEAGLKYRLCHKLKLRGLH